MYIFSKLITCKILIMKKILFLLLIGLPFLAKAQYATSIITSNVANYTYVGTLNPTGLGSAQKLIITVFGGGWYNWNSLGETTFYIGNYGDLTVNRVTMGSSDGGNITLQAYTNTNNTIDFYVYTNNWVSYAVKSIIIQGSTPVTQSIPITNSGTVPKGTTLALNINPVMITDGSGNIGLNTASPDPGYKLSVNGKVRTKEVRVEANWADYVFDNSYPLLPLEKVEHYIKDNHHLPDVPSAAEVSKNGINLGETDALLLKKIEELTLYLIEKNKENKKQQNLIDLQTEALQVQSEKLKQLEDRLKHLENNNKTN